MCHSVVRCSGCMESHLEMMSVEKYGSVSDLMLPFEVTVDLSVLESESKHMASCLKKAASGASEFLLGLTREQMNSSLRCSKCVDNKDGTFTFSEVSLDVVQRNRDLVSSVYLQSCKPVLWNECFTERQCAGMFLYCDVFLRMLDTYEIGIMINTSNSNLVRTAMCFFASLVKDPSADDVYKTRYIALHGGSSTDKKCSVCEKVGDFSECQRCKAGIYICSPGCQHSLHLDICNSLVEAPVDKRTCQNFQALQLAQEINVFTTMPIEVFEGHYCKPTLSRICKVCGAAAKHKCNTCKKVYYCSKTCQTLAFPVHKRLHHMQASLQ